MKNLKVGTIELKVVESIADINIARMPFFRAYLLSQQNQEEVAKSTDFFGGFVASFNNNDPGGMLIKAYDHYNALKNVKDLIDFDQILFSIITLEEGEVPNTWDETPAKEKMKRLAAQGLSQGIVKEEVANFIMGLMQS